MKMKYEKDWLERVAIAANVYCDMEGVDEDQIDGFLTFLFHTYGYNELLKKLQAEKNNAKSCNNY